MQFCGRNGYWYTHSNGLSLDITFMVVDNQESRVTRISSATLLFVNSEAVACTQPPLSLSKRNNIDLSMS
jgi:hypothetical protein